MPQVHTFPLLTTLFGDTRLAGQYPGNGGSPQPFQVAIDTLLAYLLEELGTGQVVAATVANNGTVSVPAGCLVEVIVVEYNGSTRTVNVGTTASGTDIADGEPQGASTPLVLRRDYYAQGATTLHFSGFSGSINVKLYMR